MAEEARSEYQQAVFGALSVMFVDKYCRDAYRDVEPSFDTIFSFCELHEAAPEALEGERRSIAARVLCMVCYRDSDVRKSLVNQGALARILELANTKGPGATHVNLCMMTIVAILVLDEAAMELIRIRKEAPMMFEGCVAQLQLAIDTLDPEVEVGEGGLHVDRKLVISMAECAAQGERTLRPSGLGAVRVCPLLPRPFCPL